MKQKLLALVCALALCAGLAGCTISTPDTVGRIGEIEIPSGLYLLAQFDAYQQAADLAGEDQDPSNTKSFLKQTITLDGESGETTLVSDYVAEKTLDILQLYAAVETRFAGLGGELTAEQLAQADSYAQQLMDQYGDLYTANGIGLESLKLYERNLFKNSALIDLVYGAEGETPVPEDELTGHLQSQMIFACYVTVPLYSTSTFALADEDQIAQILEKAQTALDAYESLKGDSDDLTVVETAFRTAVGTALPDIYAVMDSDYSADSSSSFQEDLLTRSELEAYFNAEAAEAVQNLEMNQAAAVQYSDYAAIILVRLNPLEELGLDALRSTILSDMTGEELNEALRTAGEQLENGLNSAAMSKLPATKIVNE